MKLLLLSFLLAPVMLFSQTAKPVTPGFVIDGNIKAVPENSMVYLLNFNATDTITKAKNEQGHFVLKGKTDQPQAYVLRFAGIDKYMMVFIGNDHIKIAGASKDFNDITVTGSPTNYDYDEFLYEVKPLADYVDYYRNQIPAATTQGSRDSLIISLNTAYNIYQSSIDRFIARKKNSPVAALLLAYSYDKDPNKDVMLVQQRLSTLSEEAQQSAFAKNLKQAIEIDKIGAVGTKAIDFTQEDTSGKKVSLSQFKGKYVLVDFWASWCKPCRMENPNVVEAYNQYKGKNFTVLGVSLDQDKDNWIQAIKNDNLTWTHVSDLQYWNNAAARAYRVQSIPHNILVDPQGVIIAKDLRGEVLLQKLQELLK